MGRKGINRANNSLEWMFEQQKLAGLKEDVMTSYPCIFLSHKKEDTVAVKLLSWYLEENEIDYYFDEKDNILNDPNVRKNPEKLTQRITDALLKSSHMICVISEKTKDSWWVPFEVGYAWERDYMMHDNIYLLYLNDITKPPEYFKILKTIERKEQMDQLIYNIKGTKKILTEITKIAGIHPLIKIMK